MLTRLARLSTGRSWTVVVAAVLFAVLAGAVGGGVAENLTAGGFEDPATESERADELLAERFDTGVPNVVLVVTATGGDVDAADAVAAGTAVVDDLAAEDGVTDVVSYWSEGNAPPLRSEDGSRALVLGRIVGGDDRVDERIEELGPELATAGERAGDGEAVTVEVGGFATVFHEVGDTIEEDLLAAEMIALPITLVLLVIIFGSLVAASLPLLVGGLSIIGTFFVLQVMAGITDVSVYALNLTTALGLGLAIDYSLFIVSRYREELRAGHEPRAAVIRTVRTAGRTVTFNAVTVAASLLALLVFPIAFLRSFAYAGVAVAVLAGVFSVVVLPAILALLGHRVNALTLWKRSVTPPDEGFWHRMATFVMRRPIPIATAVVALLLVLGAPFLNLRLTQPDDRVLPEGSDGRAVGDLIREEFAAEEAGALSVVTASGPLTEADTEGYAADLALLPGVARVDAATGTYCAEGTAERFGCQPGELVLGPDSADRYADFSRSEGSYLSVVPAVEPLSPEGEDLVHAVRDAPAPADVLVTGQSASLVDVNDSLFDRLPYALGIIAVITALVLFLMFGSVVIPLKAIVLNLLSLTATFGAMVWIFQEGNLAGPLDITATGGLAAAMPILMFCIAFGLSMDYEVFLLSRIKEEHDHGAGNETAVAIGLERTGRIVTAAAILMAVIFLAFATGRVSFIKLFGIGLTLAVVMDAFLIRGTLVPAFMRLAGDWNWWAPGPLRRLHDRWGISETVDLDGEDGDDDHRTPPGGRRHDRPRGGDEVAPDLVTAGRSHGGRVVSATGLRHRSPSPGGAFDDPARDPGGVTRSHLPSRRP